MRGTTVPVSLSFAASDVGAGVDYTEYSIDGGTTWTMANNVVITAPGVTHVMYRSVDLAQPSGNVEAAKTVDVKIDTAAPVTTDDYDGMWHNSDVTITLTATGGAGGVAYTEYQIRWRRLDPRHNRGRPGGRQRGCGAGPVSLRQQCR